MLRGPRRPRVGDRVEYRRALGAPWTPAVVVSLLDHPDAPDVATLKYRDNPDDAAVVADWVLYDPAGMLDGRAYRKRPKP